MLNKYKIDPILSRKNPRIQYAKKLLTSSQFRRSEQSFVLEGVRLVEEAAKSGWAIIELFYSDKLNQRGKAICAELGSRGVSTICVSDPVIVSITETDTPQGIVAILSMRQLPIPEKTDLILILDSIHDPGNVGAILRTANAAGVGAVINAPDTADPFSPKVLRAGMGAQLWLPMLTMDWSGISSFLKDYPAMKAFLADTHGGPVYWDAELRQPVALIISSEANGPSLAARKLSDGILTIPMPGNSESLNAAIATSLLVYEVLRQRR